MHIPFTWKDEDEEGTDSSNDADDFADVGHKHGDEQCHCYPQDCQHIAAAAFCLHGHHTLTAPPPAQQRVLDHGSDMQEWVCLIKQLGQFKVFYTLTQEENLA